MAFLLDGAVGVRARNVARAKAAPVANPNTRAPHWPRLVALALNLALWAMILGAAAHFLHGPR